MMSSASSRLFRVFSLTIFAAGFFLVALPTPAGAQAFQWVRQFGSDPELRRDDQRFEVHVVVRAHLNRRAGQRLLDLLADLFRRHWLTVRKRADILSGIEFIGTTGGPAWPGRPIQDRRRQ